MTFSEVHKTVPTSNTLIDVDAQRAYYSLFYETNISDSTPESRSSLIKRLESVRSSLPPGGVILDLGAGKQILEAEHISQFGTPKTVYNWRGECVYAYNFLTVDHTPLRPDQLLAHDAPHVSHLKASGDQLDPIRDASLHVALSNLALDFMPRKSIEELHRVLVPGGRVFLNLSDPRSTIPNNLDDAYARMNYKMYGNRWTRKKPQKTEDRRTLLMLKNKRMLRDAKELFETNEQIWETFTSYGFSLLSVTNCSQEDSDGWRMHWWEVDLEKPPIENLVFKA